MTKGKQNTEEVSETNGAREPAGRVKLFPVEATIWRNASKEGDKFYGVTFGRAYRDRDEKWKTSSSFNAEDLLLLAKTADLAHSKVMELRAADRQPERSEV